MRLRSRDTLRALASGARLTNRRLAEKAGVRHHSTIDHLMSGARTTASERDAAGICSALGIVNPNLLWEAPRGEAK